MKVYYLKLVFVAALAMTFSSCDKSADDIGTVSEKNAKSVSSVVYPLLGNEMSTSILPKKNHLPDGKLLKEEDYYVKAKIKLINEVCEEYLQQTKKLDISHIEEGKFREQVVNKDLTILFRNSGDLRGEGFKKLNSGPQGWWAHWNYSPYTESEYPTVLFGEDKNGKAVSGFTMLLSNDVTMFGFEIAPNSTEKDFNVHVTYNEGNYYRSQPICEVYQLVSAPSGARLIAIKSDVPFGRVEVGVGPGAEGAAIAHIRYKLR
jgi:hypothetical protein